MRSTARQTRANRTITVDFQNETTYFHLLGDGSDSRSVLKILYDLCRIPLLEPSDDPFVACDATCTAGIESILGTKPLLTSAEVELRHSHGTGASAMA